MRPQRAYGRPGTAVVPTNWGASHAPVAAGARNAVGTLRRAAERVEPTGGWEPNPRTTPTGLGTAYATDISARIQSLITHRSDAFVDVAEDTVITASYLVAVDLDLEAIEGDTFTVATCSDSTLVDQTFTVEHVVRGTERFERDLFCNLLEPPSAED